MNRQREGRSVPARASLQGVPSWNKVPSCCRLDEPRTLERKEGDLCGKGALLLGKLGMSTTCHSFDRNADM